MKIITLIKSVLKSVKQLKKPTLWGIVYEFTLLFITALSKQYKFVSPLLKLLRIFKIWAICSMTFSLVYSALADIFNFTYDYRVLAAIALGIGLLMKEYYFDIYTWFDKLFDRIVSKLQRKVIENHNSGHILNQENIDKVKSLHKPNTSYMNMEEVNKANRIDQILQNRQDSIRSYYKDYTADVDNNYNMWTDWKFYAFACCVMTSIYCLGVHYHYFPTPTDSITQLKGSVYDLYTSIKNWFTGNQGGGDSGGSSSSTLVKNNQVPENVATSSKVKLEDLPIESSGQTTPTPSTPKPSISTKNISVDDVSTQTSPVTGTDVSTQTRPSSPSSEIEGNPSDNYIKIANMLVANFYEEMIERKVNMNVYPVQWVTPMTDLDNQIFLDLKRETIGSFLFVVLEIQRLYMLLPNYRDVASTIEIDVLDTIMMASVYKLSELVNLYSITPFYDLSDLIDSMFLIAKMEHIDPIIDMTIKNRIDLILFKNVEDSLSFMFFFSLSSKVFYINMYNKIVTKYKKLYNNIYFYWMTKGDRFKVFILNHFPKYLISTVIVRDNKYNHDILMSEVLDIYDIVDDSEDETESKHIYHHNPFEEDNIFEWIKTNSYASNLKFIDFDHYKHYIFDNLLTYVNTLATLNKNGLSINSLRRSERDEILDLRDMLTEELTNLYYYTNIENSLDSYLLFAVFTRKALDELC